MFYHVECIKGYGKIVFGSNNRCPISNAVCCKECAKIPIKQKVQVMSKEPGILCRWRLHLQSMAEGGVVLVENSKDSYVGRH